jgi:hypothetical protein
MIYAHQGEVAGSAAKPLDRQFSETWMNQKLCFL